MEIICVWSVYERYCACVVFAVSIGVFAVDCQEYFVKWHAVGGQRFDGVDRETAVAA